MRPSIQLSYQLKHQIIFEQWGGGEKSIEKWEKKKEEKDTRKERGEEGGRKGRNTEWLSSHHWALIFILVTLTIWSQMKFSVLRSVSPKLKYQASSMSPFLYIQQSIPFLHLELVYSMTSLYYL